MNSFIKNGKKEIYKITFLLLCFLLLSCIVVYFIFHVLDNLNKDKKKHTEGFQWRPESTNKFLLIQHDINRDKVFDVNTIQDNQANQAEVDYFNKNGSWPWSKETKDLYVEAIKRNPYIRTFPEGSLHYAMSIYNETAILRVLSYQAKEGQFLLHGVSLKNSSGNKLEELPNGFGDFVYNDDGEPLLFKDNSKDIIRCNANNGLNLERVTYRGKDPIFGSQLHSVSKVDYNDLERTVPGFTFLHGPCNPCVALNDPPDYSCPFQFKEKKDDNTVTTNIWKKLWNI